jgi:hypothetical protein
VNVQRGQWPGAVDVSASGERQEAHEHQGGDIVLAVIADTGVRRRHAGADGDCSDDSILLRRG